MVHVFGLEAVRGDLDLTLAQANDHRTEAVRVERAAEERLDLRRLGVGRDIPVLGLDAAQREARAREVLEWVDLAKFADFYPADLSGGMKKRAGLALWSFVITALTSRGKRRLRFTATPSLGAYR